MLKYFLVLSILVLLMSNAITRANENEMDTRDGEFADDGEKEFAEASREFDDGDPLANILTILESSIEDALGMKAFGAQAQDVISPEVNAGNTVEETRNEDEDEDEEASKEDEEAVVKEEATEEKEDATHDTIQDGDAPVGDDVRYLDGESAQDEGYEADEDAPEGTTHDEEAAEENEEVSHEDVHEEAPVENDNHTEEEPAQDETQDETQNETHDEAQETNEENGKDDDIYIPLPPQDPQMIDELYPEIKVCANCFKQDCVQACDKKMICEKLCDGLRLQGALCESVCSAFALAE